MLWVNSTATTLDLPRELSASEHWGKAEAAMLFEWIDEKMLADFRRAPYQLQLKAIHQICLCLGLRTGSLVPGPRNKDAEGNKKDILLRSNITIYQRKRGCYELNIDLRHLKNFTAVKHLPTLIQPVIPPVQRASNLQFEPISSLVPLLLSTRSIYVLDDDGTKRYLADADEFCESTAYRFFVEGDEAVFKDSFERGRSLSSAPLSAVSVATATSKLAFEVCLPDGRVYNWRHNAGNVMRIIGGKDKQAIALNHGQGMDAGSRHYSTGISNIPISRYVLGEFNPADAGARDKLEASGYLDRLRDSRAVQSVILSQREKRSGTVSHTTVAVNASLDEVIATDEILHHLQLERDTLDANATSEERANSRRKVNYRMTVLRNAEYKKIKDKRNAAWRKHPGGSVEEHEKAEAIINRLIEGLPRLLRQPYPESAQAAAPSDDHPLRLLMGTEPGPEDVEDDFLEDEEGEEQYIQRNFDQIRAQGAQAHSGSVIPLNQKGFDEHQLLRHVSNVCRQRQKKAEDETISVTEAETGAMIEEGNPDDPDRVIALRHDLIRKNFDLVCGRVDAHTTFKNFVRQNGYCPICPIGEVGVCAYSTKTLNWLPTPTGLTSRTADMPYAGMMKHLEEKHPVELQMIREGVMFPMRGDINRTDHTDQELEAIARVYKQALDMDYSALAFDATDEQIVEGLRDLYGEL